eukprot:scaffold609_cov234-Pinguiococcus_pyrenoidosus.AAC.13
MKLGMPLSGRKPQYTHSPLRVRPQAILVAFVQLHEARQVNVVAVVVKGLELKPGARTLGGPEVYAHGVWELPLQQRLVGAHVVGRVRGKDDPVREVPQHLAFPFNLPPPWEKRVRLQLDARPRDPQEAQQARQLPHRIEGFQAEIHRPLGGRRPRGRLLLKLAEPDLRVLDDGLAEDSEPFCEDFVHGGGSSSVEQDIEGQERLDRVDGLSVELPADDQLAIDHQVRTEAAAHRIDSAWRNVHAHLAINQSGLPLFGHHQQVSHAVRFLRTEVERVGEASSDIPRCAALQLVEASLTQVDRHCSRETVCAFHAPVASKSVLQRLKDPRAHVGLNLRKVFEARLGPRI